MLRHDGYCWLKFKNGQIFHAKFVGCCMMLYSFGQARAIMMRHAHQFDLQHPTRRTTSQLRVDKRAQHVGPNTVTTCCVGMLRSFGRGVKIQKVLMDTKCVNKEYKYILSNTYLRRSPRLTDDSNNSVAYRGTFTAIIVRFVEKYWKT